MFDPKKWIEESPGKEDAVITVADQKIKIQRLAGTQWEQYLKLGSSLSASSMALVLHHGIVNEQNGGQFTLEEMTALYDACPAKADKIALQILDLTIKTISEERKAAEKAEKNFESPDTRQSSGDGVGTTK